MNEKFTQGTWCPDFETGNIYPDGIIRGNSLGMVTCLINKEEYEANLRLIANAPALYSVLLQVRPFFSHDGHIREQIENLLREINPNFDKRPEVTDIKGFAERVKNMRDWQKEHAKTHSEDSQRYVDAQQDLVDSIVADILQEDKS